MPHLAALVFHIHFSYSLVQGNFKVLLLTFKALNDIAPVYISNLLIYCMCSLNPVDVALLVTPQVPMCDQDFAICATQL